MSPPLPLSRESLSPATPVPQGFNWQAGLRYGLPGLPLAFVALPLYVILPNHYARAFGMPLATLGALLLIARLFDALIDPWLGRWVDTLFIQSARRVLHAAAAGCAVLALGFVALFFPPARGSTLVAWAFVALLITYAAYSLVSVAHQSWGARLGGDATQRSRIVGWREGLGLVGVLMASVLPTIAGLQAMAFAFCVALVAGWLCWSRSPQPPAVVRAQSGPNASIWLPFSRPGFTGLLAVFVCNGVASAIPATLVLFFIQDRLQAPPAWEGAFLASYFLAAALSMPLWLRAVARFGLWRVWLAGMLLAVAVFVCAATLSAGDSWPFILVCAGSGIALGADLAVPGALLAGLIQRSGDQGAHEGAYFGWWNFANKLNLALAAGLALPLLAVFGYSPGARSAPALQALVVAYCVLPCALKLIAAYAVFIWARAQNKAFI